MKLDVGCGDKPKGDVNCDLFIGKSPHLSDAYACIKKPENFVLCDANYLPFKDSAFTVVHSSHILEHLKNPLSALQEFCRVTSKIVYLKIPHGTRSIWQHDYHLYCWDRKTFRNLLSHVFPKVEVYCTLFQIPRGGIFDRLEFLMILITHFFFKIVPSELTAICRKA